VHREKPERLTSYNFAFVHHDPRHASLQNCQAARFFLIFCSRCVTHSVGEESSSPGAFNSNDTPDVFHCASSASGRDKFFDAPSRLMIARAPLVIARAFKNKQTLSAKVRRGSLKCASLTRTLNISSHCSAAAALMQPIIRVCERRGNFLLFCLF
jgi:hypothetical protein